MPAIPLSKQPILSYFYKWEREIPHKDFLKQPYGEEWLTLTWKQAGDQARRIAQALRSLDLPPQSRIGILSKNCYHWVLADLAIMMAGHISVPYYPNLSPSALEVVVQKSKLEVLFVGKLDNWEQQSAAIPEDLRIVTFPQYEGNSIMDRGYRWETLLSRHQPLQGNPLPKMEDIWTILFTSGTTGTPKGVILTHEAPAQLIASEKENSDLGIFQLAAGRFFSFLPMNHVGERIGVEFACLVIGGCVSFGESLATFAKNLQDAKPTVFFAVPRIWTKFQLAVFEKLPPKKLTFLLSLPLVGNYVRTKIRRAMGLNRAEIILTGAAPTPESLKAWYRRLGLRLREVYGMTETCGPFCVIPSGHDKPGTVGRPLHNVQVKIDEQSSEIMVKAAWLMKGYFEEPEMTEEVFQDGWLRTGDQGKLVDGQFLQLTGRVKDAFKTAKGKYVVPGPLEWEFDSNELVEQICVVGRGLPQPLALIVLSEIGRRRSPSEVRDLLQKDLARINDGLSNFEKISTLIIMDEDWSVENQILTPTLKVRRNQVDEKYESQYNDWHESQDRLIWKEPKR